MALTVNTGDARTKVLTGAAGTEIQGYLKVNGHDTKVFCDASGIVAEIGRGETDADITFLALRQEDGTRTYLYPNAAGNGLIVTATKP